MERSLCDGQYLLSDCVLHFSFEDKLSSFSIEAGSVSWYNAFDSKCCPSSVPEALDIWEEEERLEFVDVDEHEDDEREQREDDVEDEEESSDSEELEHEDEHEEEDELAEQHDVDSDSVQEDVDDEDVDLDADGDEDAVELQDITLPVLMFLLWLSLWRFIGPWRLLLLFLSSSDECMLEILQEPFIKFSLT